MVVASALLALVIAAAFAVLLSSVADLRASERRARQSEEVLVEANRLERLVVDLETGQRGFLLTRRHELGFFTRLKDNGSHSQAGQSEAGNDDDNKSADSKMHGVWQGS